MQPTFAVTRSSMADLAAYVGVRFRRPGWFVVGKEHILVSGHEGAYSAFSWPFDPRPAMKEALCLPTEVVSK